MAQLLLENITKDFPGGVRALDGFSFAVPDGEFVVVVGPSGSGKSTLLRLVAGLERITAGTIRIGEQVVNDLAPRHRNVAMAFQHPALYPHLSVFENLAFPLRLRKIPRNEINQRVRKAAEQLAIASLLDRKPATISGGERQRVALGRVLVRDAQCNLYDEPLAHLDRPLVEQLQSCLLEIHRRRPTTTLFVTHDQQEALALGARIVVLAGGRIQQVAPPLDIYDRPANRFVAGFFGSPAMNFLPGQLIADEGRMWFVSSTMRLQLGDSLAKRFGPRAGNSLVAGIRPEAICELDSLAPSLDGHSIAATVRRSEVQGDRVFHHLETDAGQLLVSRGVIRTPLSANSLQRFCIDANQMQFFETGEFGASLTSDEPRV